MSEAVGESVGSAVDAPPSSYSDCDRAERTIAHGQLKSIIKLAAELLVRQLKHIDYLLVSYFNSVLHINEFVS